MTISRYAVLRQLRATRRRYRQSSAGPNSVACPDRSIGYTSSPGLANSVAWMTERSTSSRFIDINKSFRRTLSSQSTSTESKSLEETYSRKTPLEHILLRPSMYIGPTERLPAVPCWVLQQDVTLLDAGSNNSSKSSTDNSPSPWLMQREELSSVPALLKVFDEILVNASDNRLRHPGSCNRIDVTIHRGDNSSDPFISIMNNGKSIPIQIHRKEKMYIPELLFGHLLTGSNFNDDQKRLTGGRHGYGAKLTNVFSKQFVVEIGDGHSSRGKCKTYKQVWEDNMHVCHEAEVQILNKSSGKDFDEYTKISFVPDLARLTGDPSVKIIPDEEYKLMRRRVIDIAGCSGGKMLVTLNGEDVSCSDFQEYVDLYRKPQLNPMYYHKMNARWEVAVGLSETKSFESISFVNGMNTSRGGTHVDELARQISHHIANHINTKMAKQLDHFQNQIPLNVTPRMVRRHLFLCVNSLIENPSFDSQMKECLTSNPITFGSDYTIPQSLLKKIVRPAIITDESDEDSDGSDSEQDTNTKQGGPGIVEEVLRAAIGNQQVNMARLLREVGGGKQTKRQVLSIPKLEDANLAGTAKGAGCTLILTEGDSAKALAVAGLEVISRDKYGVFPLRGKFLNVRSVSVDKLAKNAELKAICTILGLQFDKTYHTLEDREQLRYGHVMLMTDQDADGSHIKGLIMNLFRHFWPELLKPPKGSKGKRGSDTDRPFMSMFVTPLLKATKKGKGKNKASISFFSMSEYNAWRESLEDDEIRNWSVKYYKGLGTSTPAEAKVYFLDFIKHHRPLRWQSEKKDGERIDMAFEKEKADERKDWILTKYDEKSSLTINEDDGNSVTYGDFVDCELIHFSNANNIRSLPSVIDGLKPSQRKVLYACFKRNLKDEIKVAQLSGYCAEHTAYHHGEASLHATIVGMAQDFVGSNNMNLLMPKGQFGTRLIGGADAASPRYIFTHLSPVARLLFPDVDDALLDYKEEEGQLIEPDFFVPVIPLLLVNGCQGIGTGWSTYIPQHDPLDVLKYIRAKLEGKKRLPSIRPWVKGFDGNINIDEERASYITEGTLTITSKSSLSITELPVGVWTSDYKEYLVKMLKKGEIKSFTENHTTSAVSFDVKVNMAKLTRLMKGDIHKTFKLRNSLSTRNMHAFTPDMDIIRYKSPRDIADAFFPIRLGLYADRKSVLESNMEYSTTLMRNKARFIQAVSTNDIDLLNGKKSKDATIALLEEMEFVKQSDLEVIKSNNTVAKRRAFNTVVVSEELEQDPHALDPSKEYDYLLSMPLSSLTAEKIEALNNEAAKMDAKMEELKNTSVEELWKSDLDKLESHLNK